MRSTNKHRGVAIAVAALSMGGAVATAATAPGATPGHIIAASRLGALEGKGPLAKDVRFGAQLDWAGDSPSKFQGRSGLSPAVYGEFLEFPFKPVVAYWLEDKIHAVKEAHGVFMLTLQPGLGIRGDDGLKAVTDQSVADLGKVLRTWNSEGVPVIVRYGQEMNGAWYPWGQRPAEYIKSFRKVAAAVHTAPQSRMLWSPNDGGGYPFAGGRWEAKKGTAAFRVLDTNHDGKLTQQDDPYKPYWPGSRYVDWVGLSLYHFGHKYPWNANVLPEKNKFVDKLTGHFNGGNGDERAVPDFYATYSAAKHKPMAISETAALYNTGVKGASEVAIKSAWMDQVFASDIPKRFPNLRLIDWFEQRKRENDVHSGDVDWRSTYNPRVLAALKARIPTWLTMAPKWLITIQGVDVI